MEQQYRTVLTKALSSRSGGLGLQQAKVDQANHLQALLTQYKSTDAKGNVTYNIPTSQYAELAMGLANLVSPSGSAESDRQAIMAATAKSGLSGALQYITGQPQNGNSQAIIQNLVDSINRQGQVANNLRDQYVSYMKGLAPTGLAQDRVDALNKAALPSFDPNGTGSNVDTGAAVAGQGDTPAAGTTGTLSDGTVVTLNPDGTITDAQGNQYNPRTATNFNMAISWNTPQTPSTGISSGFSSPQARQLSCNGDQQCSRRQWNSFRRHAEPFKRLFKSL